MRVLAAGFIPALSLLALVALADGFRTRGDKQVGSHVDHPRSNEPPGDKMWSRVHVHTRPAPKRPLMARFRTETRRNVVEEVGRIRAPRPFPSRVSANKAATNCEEGGKSAFVGRLEVPGTLERAVEALGTDGRIVLLAVGASSKKLPSVVTNALGVAHAACTHGAPGTLLLGFSKEVCEFATSQQVVSLRACVWTTFLNSPSDWWDTLDRSKADYERMTHGRIHWFSELLKLERKVKVVFSDTDVCFKNNPFPALEHSGYSLILSGRFSNFNLGTIFARNDLTAGVDALRVVTEADERLAYLRGLGHTNPGLKSQYQKTMWDQGLVNDVFESYQVGKEVWTRVCFPLALPQVPQEDQCLVKECCNLTRLPPPEGGLEFPKRLSQQILAHGDILGDGNLLGMGEASSRLPKEMLEAN
uniref:Nucleotide-diphospho-sugar transferase domain-containing protein n=1 Tax=Pyramimonas obovata TaxID=1411642 RepID=A0A7S0WNU6_9CHLO|mmetsp:Transcript_32341/g.70598  ORF Transcript_32341/g.70598 Transcript_32341/m.70598 type:complete len:417 (+) Transcript_32341:87-1337(+)